MMGLQTELWSAIGIGGLAASVALALGLRKPQAWNLPLQAFLASASAYLVFEGIAQMQRAVSGHALPHLPHSIAQWFGSVAVACFSWLAGTLGDAKRPWIWALAGVLVASPGIVPVLGSWLATTAVPRFPLAASDLAYAGLEIGGCMVLARRARQPDGEWPAFALAALSALALPRAAVALAGTWPDAGFPTSFEWNMGVRCALLVVLTTGLLVRLLWRQTQNPVVARTAWAIIALNGAVLLIFIAYSLRSWSVALNEGPYWTMPYLLVLVFLRRGLLRFGLVADRHLAIIRNGGNAALAFTCASGVASLLILLPGISLIPAMCVALAATFAVVAVRAGLRRSLLFPTGKQDASARATYVALLEANAGAEAVARARLELGLSPADARELERRVAFSRQSTPKKGRALAPGDQVADNYDVQASLGTGATARTFRAWDRAQERTVVLKEFRVDAGAPRDRLDAIAREARILMHLRHSGLAKILDVVRAPGSIILVLEHVQGTDLRTWGRMHRSDPKGTLSMLRDVGTGLATLHDHSIVHCDVKPENIIVSSRGKATLVDFGSARVAARQATMAARSLTPRYASPEQQAGKTLGPPADVYAFGVVTRELAANLPVGLRLALEEIVRPALAVRPDQRPNLRELLGALADLEARFMADSRTTRVKARQRAQRDDVQARPRPRGIAARAD